MESPTTSINSTAADYASSINSSSSGEDHILDDIVRALDSWTQRIFTLETDLQRNTDIKRNIADCLQKQVLDGLIKREDANELEYILDLWANLHQAYVCKQIGIEFSIQEVLSNLLDLFNLKQIGKTFVIHVMLKLCLSKEEEY